MLSDFCLPLQQKYSTFMAVILIIAGIILIIIGTAGRRGSVSRDHDWANEGREKMRIGDKEYWV